MTEFIEHHHHFYFPDKSKTDKHLNKYLDFEEICLGHLFELLGRIYADVVLLLSFLHLLVAAMAYRD